MNTSTTAHVAIVGAGHAGLCVVKALNDRGVTPHVFEPARVGDRWRARYRALLLNTDAASSAIPGHPPPMSMPRWPTADQWADYLESVAARLDYEHTSAEVHTVEPAPGGWKVTSADARTHPFDAVVIATGRDRVPWIPDWPGSDHTTIEVVHSSEFRQAEDFAGRRVLVVGSGNSGTEIAHLLSDAAQRVAISIRTRPLFATRETLGVSITQVGRIAKHVPARILEPGARLLQRVQFGDLERIGLAPPDLELGDLADIQGPTMDSGFISDVRNGRIEVVDDIERFTDDCVVFRDGTSFVPDTVMAATGYRTGLENVVDDRFLDTDGWPTASQPPFRQAPGLYFAGFLPATLTAFMPDFVETLDSIADDILTAAPGGPTRS